MYHYKQSLIDKILRKKSEPFIIVTNQSVFLPELNKDVFIKDITAIKLVHQKIHVRVSYKFEHVWVLVVGEKEFPFIEQGHYHKKDIIDLIKELQSINPNINLEDQGMLSQSFKRFDRTVNSTIYEADKKAAFYNQTLDDVLGFSSVILIIGISYGFTYLSKLVEYNYFGFSDVLRTFFMAISGVFISLVIVNELISPFVRAYLGKTISVLSLIIGLLILVITI